MHNDRMNLRSELKKVRKITKRHSSNLILYNCRFDEFVLHSSLFICRLTGILVLPWSNFQSLCQTLSVEEIPQHKNRLNSSVPYLNIFKGL